MANQGFLPVRTESGGPPVIGHYAVKASQTIKRGYPLRMSSTSPGSLATALATATGIWGIAAEPVTTTATEKTTRVAVWVANKDTVFEGKNTGTGRPEQWIGDLVDFEITTTSNFRVNENAGSTKVLKIVSVHPDDLSGTASGKRIRFKISPLKSQYDGSMEVD